MTDTKFWPQLNPDLDLERAKAQFAFQRRVQISDFFEPETATRLHDCLMTETPWGFGYMDGNEPRMMHRRELEGLTRARSDRISKTITTQAGSGDFSFGYFCYPMMEAAVQGWNPELVLHEVTAFLNSEQMLETVRAISGKASLMKAEALATLFSHQHFLTMSHAPSETWSGVNFMISLTRDWREDWGGYMQFYNADGDIVQGFKPRFNALCLFDPSQRFSISYVPPYAAIGRLAITGTFR